ncbi:MULTISPECIES: inositol monophosphatase family protein [Nocardia]|uniref:inositol-phosphate phosphatase n=1 Tax=Nocardia nova TaxID=37330 RepID=A0A2S6A894_9NOCA|nr:MULTISPECIES: inositol monophosphatase family protein [Nocardia]OBF65207.1 inositol monophosphatase [Mycobacterium sp. 852002-51759_SCH5129042]MBF6274544.1 inositol monophosphatase family protein [Nocardia nova]MBV7705094.1 inositol monophosphatase family protein [Nocardia nova]OBA49129.1 inositol monophosphatase [Nocardia sp. 852002-51101_SCH5132738]OBB42249.1 inositol monophosphatase [Nocardia sp. 852002-51244_SCH5132740]
MTSAVSDPAALLATASEILDGAAPRFVEGLGAPSAVQKGRGDFATALDLELERTLSQQLADRTGIPVHGEEFGGPELSSGTAWVLDPIDGTFNYSAGHPLSAMLLALVADGQPVLGLTWLPLLDRRYAAAAGGPLLLNGKPLPPLEPGRLAEAMIGFGAFNIDAHGRIPGRFRFDLLGALSRLSSRVRMHGSTGIDLAYTASGVLGGAVVFGHHPWDNAAGVALVRAAGGVVTDLRGDEWSITSRSVLAAAPGVHEELLDMIDSAVDRASERNENSEGTQ